MSTAARMAMNILIAKSQIRGQRSGVRDQRSEISGTHPSDKYKNVVPRGRPGGAPRLVVPVRLGGCSLTAYDQHDKAARDDRRARARIVGGWVGPGAEFGGDQVDAVGGGVVSHGAGAALRGQALKCWVAGGRGIDYGEDSLAAGGEGQFMRRVPAGCIGAVGDGGVGQYLAGIGIDHGHVLAVADREQAAARDVEGQAAGAVAAG